MMALKRLIRLFPARLSILFLMNAEKAIIARFNDMKRGRRWERQEVTPGIKKVAESLARDCLYAAGWFDDNIIEMLSAMYITGLNHGIDAASKNN